MKIVCSIEIHAPIAKVFEVINDEDQYKLWLEGVEETIREPGYDPKHPQGSRFVQKIREGRKVQAYHGQIVAYHKPRHLGVVVSNDGMTAHVDYRLKSEKKSTHVEFTSQLEFKNLALKLVVGMSHPVLKGLIAKQLTSLKELVESQV